jgi:hypothetical protein
VCISPGPYGSAVGDRARSPGVVGFLSKKCLERGVFRVFFFPRRGCNFRLITVKPQLRKLQGTKWVVEMMGSILRLKVVSCIPGTKRARVSLHHEQLSPLEIGNNYGRRTARLYFDKRVRSFVFVLSLEKAKRKCVSLRMCQGRFHRARCAFSTLILIARALLLARRWSGLVWF